METLKAEGRFNMKDIEQLDQRIIEHCGPHAEVNYESIGCTPQDVPHVFRASNFSRNIST